MSTHWPPSTPPGHPFTIVSGRDSPLNTRQPLEAAHLPSSSWHRASTSRLVPDPWLATLDREATPKTPWRPPPDLQVLFPIPSSQRPPLKPVFPVFSLHLGRRLLLTTPQPCLTTTHPPVRPPLRDTASIFLILARQPRSYRSNLRVPTLSILSLSPTLARPQLPHPTLLHRFRLRPNAYESRDVIVPEHYSRPPKQPARLSEAVALTAQNGHHTGPSLCLLPRARPPLPPSLGPPADSARTIDTAAGATNLYPGRPPRRKVNSKPHATRHPRQSAPPRGSCPCDQIISS